MHASKEPNPYYSTRPDEAMPSVVENPSHPTHHLVSSGRIIEQDGWFINASTGDWYLPLEERNGTREKEYTDYLREGSQVWSAAIGVHSPNYDDEELISKRLIGKDSGAGGHVWLTLLGPNDQKTVTEANLAESKTLDAFIEDLQPNLPTRQRIINRGRQLLATEERVIDDRDNNNRYPHSIMEIFITSRMAETLRLDIAAHEWMAGKSNDFKSARFNAINLRGQNCLGYVTSLLEGVGLNLNRAMNIKNIPLVNNPTLSPSLHRAGYRMAQTRTGVVLPATNEMPNTTVHPVDFDGAGKGNVYLLDSSIRPRPKGSVSHVLQKARSQGVVIPDESGSFTSCLPEGLERVNEINPTMPETLELPQEATEHIAELLHRHPSDLQVVQKYSAGSNGSTFQLGKDVVLKIFEPGFSSKTSQDFSRSAAIQRILHSKDPDLVPELYASDAFSSTADFSLAGVEKPFMVMEKVDGKIVKEPTAGDATKLGETLARFHTLSEAIITELGEDAFERTPKAARMVDQELLGQTIQTAAGFTDSPYTSLGILLKSVVSAPFLHRKIEKKDIPKGVLHMDFHWPNCLFGAEPKVIDFDACATGAFIDDIGNTMLLSFTLLENGSFNFRTDLVHPFLKAYNGVRQLTSDEFKLLPDALVEQTDRIVLRNNRYAARPGHWSSRVMPKAQFSAARRAFLDSLSSTKLVIAQVATGAGLQNDV